MNVNRRLAVAVHVLALVDGGEWSLIHGPATSERMARSVNTNPVVIRRILGSLRNAGLVTSRPGPGGGWRVTRPADEITLKDVFLALRDDDVFGMPLRTTDDGCPIGRCLPTLLAECFREVEAAIEAKLATLTIADVVASALAEGWGEQRNAIGPTAAAQPA
ncbi:MAG: Rrf2 family transcriptional regulator [Thermomicrobiales bacterium]